MKLFKLNKKLMLRAFLIVHNRIKIDVNNFFGKMLRGFLGKMNGEMGLGQGFSGFIKI